MVYLDENSELPADADEARALIDAHILQIHDEPRQMQKISALRARRNSLAQISRLPPEVLAKIFVVFRRFRTYDRQWNRVAEVCRHWRGVALNCPEMWSAIEFYLRGERNIPRFQELQFERSKSVPLEILAETRGVGVGTPQIDELIYQCMLSGRLRALTLNVYYPMLDCMPVQRILNGLPVSLESLVVESSKPVSSFSLPAREIPQLKRLQLIGINITAWDPLLFPHLSHLHLERIQGISWDQLYTALQARKSRLNSLVLIGSFMDGIVQQQSPNRNSHTALVLSQLHLLYLGADVTDTLCDFLGRVRIPASSHLHLSAGPTAVAGDPSDEFIQLFEAISTCRQSSAIDTKYLSLRYSSDGFVLEGWADGSRIALRRPTWSTEEPSFSLELKVNSFWPIPSPEQGDFPGFPVMHTEVLHLAPAKGASHPDAKQERILWDNVMNLPHLSTLSIKRGPFHHFCFLFGLIPSTPNMPLPFSALRTLLLNSIDLNNPSFGGKKELTPFDFLKGCLSRRRNSGLAGLDYLELRNCQGVDDEKVGQLRRYVSTVEQTTSSEEAFDFPPHFARRLYTFQYV